jgi:outer membrane protein TolC
MTSPWVSSAFVLVLVVAVATSSPAAHASNALTPDDAVALALRESHVVRAQALRIESDRLELMRIRLRSPELQLGHRSINDLNSDTSAVDPFNDSQVALSWRPPALEDFGLRQGAGADTADALWRDVDDARATIATEVRLLHARVLSLRAQRDLAASRVTLLEDVGRVQESRVEAQVGTSLDVGLTLLDTLDARADVTDVEGDLSRVEQRLAALLRVSAPATVAPPSTPLCALVGDDDTLLATAMTQAPRLRALTLRQSAIAQQQTAAALRFVPWVEGLQVGLVQNPNRDAELRARLDITLPFFEPLNPVGRILDKDTERIAAERAAVTDELRQRITTANERLKSYVALVAVYDGAAADIDVSQKAVADSLAADVVDILKVATVQDRVLKARRAGLRAQLLCDEARIEVMSAMGIVAPPSRRPWDEDQ